MGTERHIERETVKAASPLAGPHRKRPPHRRCAHDYHSISRSFSVRCMTFWFPWDFEKIYRKTLSLSTMKRILRGGAA